MKPDEPVKKPIFTRSHKDHKEKMLNCLRFFLRGFACAQRLRVESRVQGVALCEKKTFYDFVKPGSNIILIGMPGCGKSTVGVILAKHCRKGFIDTDLLIQAAAGRALQDVVDNEGYLALRKLEEEVLLGLEATDTVIATGGSAVHSRPAMERLKSTGIVVFLDADLPTLRSRVNDFGARGLAKRPDQSFEQLYAERRPLYQRYADVTVPCAGLTQEEVSARVGAPCAKRMPL
jgi:shikimate kinase